MIFASQGPAGALGPHAPAGGTPAPGPAGGRRKWDPSAGPRDAAGSESARRGDTASEGRFSRYAGVVPAGGLRGGGYRISDFLLSRLPFGSQVQTGTEDNSHKVLKLLVPGEGFEPPTFGLQNRCTATVLTRLG